IQNIARALRGAAAPTPPAETTPIPGGHVSSFANPPGFTSAQALAQGLPSLPKVTILPSITPQAGSLEKIAITCIGETAISRGKVCFRRPVTQALLDSVIDAEEKENGPL